MTLGEFLKQERLKRGLTQRQMAEKLDISRTHYTCIESGYKNPKGEYTHKAGVSLLNRIATLVHRSPAFLYKLANETYKK